MDTLRGIHDVLDTSRIVVTVDPVAHVADQSRFASWTVGAADADTVFSSAPVRVRIVLQQRGGCCNGDWVSCDRHITAL